MQALLRDSVVPIWLLLMAATGLSWWLGTGQGSATEVHTWATVGLMIVAFVKVRFVGLHFMELRHAPWPLRLIFEAWVVLVCLVVLSLYATA